MKKFKRKVLAMLMTNNFGSSLRQQLFDGAPFRSSLLYTAVPQRAASGTTGTFTRATTATVRDHEGVLRTAIAGEARFEGARRVRNLVAGSSENLTNGSWTNDNATSPSATIILASAGSARHLRFNVAPAASAGNVYLLQAKLTAGTHRYACIGERGDAIWRSVTFDLQTGTKGTEKNATGTITALGGGQYLCAMIYTRTNATNMQPSIGVVASNTSVIDDSFNAAGTETIVAEEIQLEDVTAQTTQTAGEYVSVGVESAPYYHGSFVDGVKCFNTDLEYYPTNLLTKSQELSDAVTWNASNATVTANQTTAPDGTLTADLYTAAANAQQTVWYAPSITTAAVFAYSLHIKAGTASWINLNLWDGAGSPGGIQGWFNVATGAVGSLTASAGFTAYSSDSEDLGDGWFRISVIGRTTGTIYPAFRVTDSDGSNASTATNGKTVYLWGAQLEQSGRVTTYIPTTTTAVTSTTLEGGNALTTMLGYLAEGARTNLTIWNRDLTNAAWTRRSGTVTTALTAVGADGAANSATAVRNLGATGVDDLYQTASYAVTAGVRVEPSLSLRAVSTSGTLRFANAYDVGASGAWNIDLSLVSTTRMERITRNHPSVTITSEWVGGSLNFVQPIFDTTTGPLNFDVDLIQVEVGTFSSTGIATTTAAVTRNADVLTYSSAGNIDGTKGWCYAEVTTEWASGTSVYNAVIGSYTSSVGPLIGQGNAPTEIRLRDGTNSVSSPAFTSMATGSRKVASTWGGSDAKVTASGLTPTSGSFDGDMGFTNIPVGCTALSDAQWYGTIRNVRIGQRQLSASELQAITS